jgi:hypothetical protein
MIYDLDPPEGTKEFGAVRQAALDVRDVLCELDIKSWVQTTGSKGFHVIVPLDRSLGFDPVRRFARDVALLLVRRHQDRYTLEQRKRERGGAHLPGHTAQRLRRYLGGALRRARAARRPRGDARRLAGGGAGGLAPRLDA